MNTSSNAVRGAEIATEQLQLELERLRSELDRCTTRLQLTEKLLEHVADAVFVADVEGRIIDVNPAACSLLGYERQELLKMRMPFTLKISRDYWMYGRSCWLRESPGNGKLGCGVSTERIVGSCSGSNRCSMRQEISSSGMARIPTSTTANAPKRSLPQRRKFSN